MTTPAQVQEALTFLQRLPKRRSGKKNPVPRSYDRSVHLVETYLLSLLESPPPPSPPVSPSGFVVALGNLCPYITSPRVVWILVSAVPDATQVFLSVVQDGGAPDPATAESSLDRRSRPSPSPQPPSPQSPPPTKRRKTTASSYDPIMDSSNAHRPSPACFPDLSGSLRESGLPRADASTEGEAKSDARIMQGGGG